MKRHGTERLPQFVEQCKQGRCVDAGNHAALRRLNPDQHHSKHGPAATEQHRAAQNRQHDAAFQVRVEHEAEAQT
jgi:hypothetical protein